MIWIVWEHHDVKRAVRIARQTLVKVGLHDGEPWPSAAGDLLGR